MSYLLGDVFTGLWFAFRFPMSMITKGLAGAEAF